MTTEKIIMETVTLDEADLVDAVFLLMRDKGYLHIKKSDISINPTTSSAKIIVQNIDNGTDKKD